MVQIISIHNSFVGVKENARYERVYILFFLWVRYICVRK